MASTRTHFASTFARPCHHMPAPYEHIQLESLLQARSMDTNRATKRKNKTRRAEDNGNALLLKQSWIERPSELSSHWCETMTPQGDREWDVFGDSTSIIAAGILCR